MAHIKKYYGTKDIVISCAGNFQPEEMIAAIREAGYVPVQRNTFYEPIRG